jgi:hypothetical protein
VTRLGKSRPAQLTQQQVDDLARGNHREHAKFVRATRSECYGRAQLAASGSEPRKHFPEGDRRHPTVRPSAEQLGTANLAEWARRENSERRRPHDRRGRREERSNFSECEAARFQANAQARAVVDDHLPVESWTRKQALTCSSIRELPRTVLRECHAKVRCRRCWLVQRGKATRLRSSKGQSAG